MNEPPTPAPSGVLERVAELLDRAAKAEAFNAAHRVGCCEAGYRLPGRNKPCIECGATVAGPCLKAYDKPPAEYRRAVLRDALPLIRDLASALAEARAAAELYEAMQDACRKLPAWWDISFTVEKDGGWIHLSDPEGNSISVDEFGSVDSSLAEQVAEAVAFALEHDVPDDRALTPAGRGDE